MHAIIFVIACALIVLAFIASITFFAALPNLLNLFVGAVIAFGVAMLVMQLILKIK